MIFETTEMQKTLITAESFLDVTGSLLSQEAQRRKDPFIPPHDLTEREGKLTVKGYSPEISSSIIKLNNIRLTQVGYGLMTVASMGGCYPYVLYKTDYQRKLLTGLKYIKIIRYRSFEQFKKLMGEIWFSTYIVSHKEIKFLEALSKLTQSTEIIITKKSFEKLIISDRFLKALYKLESESMCDIVSSGFNLAEEIKNENSNPSS